MHRRQGAQRGQDERGKGRIRDLEDSVRIPATEDHEKVDTCSRPRRPDSSVRAHSPLRGGPFTASPITLSATCTVACCPSAIHLPASRCGSGCRDPPPLRQRLQNTLHIAGSRAQGGGSRLGSGGSSRPAQGKLPVPQLFWVVACRYIVGKRVVRFLSFLSLRGIRPPRQIKSLVAACRLPIPPLVGEAVGRPPTRVGAGTRVRLQPQ